MAKLPNTKWLGARASEKLYALSHDYANLAEISIGDLLRKALEEFMINHPIKEEKK